MTISEDLFLAILSMNSYNPGVSGLAADDSMIGNATIGSDALPPSEPQAAGFYAAAYDSNHNQLCPVAAWTTPSVPTVARGQ